MNELYLITGSNLGDKRSNLETASRHIAEQIGDIVVSSSIYETEPWGNALQPSFYNQAHRVITSLTAGETMRTILKIEQQMGRVRTIKNAARSIDIDILFFNQETIETQDLTIPHKEICNRNFVLQPLKEIAPALIHPQYQKSVTELSALCTDRLKAHALSNAS